MILLSLIQIALIILCLILSVWGCNSLWLSYQKLIHQTKFGDKKELSEQLDKWKSPVLRRGGTLRNFKQFANRSRFVTADEELSGMIPQLVGFIALEEIGAISPSMHELVTDDGKKAWLESVESEFAEKDRLIVKAWLTTVDSKHWECYQALAIEGPAFEQVDVMVTQ